MHRATTLTTDGQLMTDQRFPGARALELRRLTRTEAQARSMLAQRARACTFEWGEQEWEMTLGPTLETGPLEAQAGQWLVQVHWAGCGFDLLVPGTAAEAWIASAFPEVDPPQLPEEFAAAALEAACEGLLHKLADMRQGVARLESLARGPSQALDRAHHFDLCLRCGEWQVPMHLATDSVGLMLMAGLVTRRQPVENDLPLQELPMLLRAELGFTWLSAGELAGLRSGDAVLMEHAFATADGELWLGHQDWGLRAYWSDTTLTVTTAFTRGGWTMPVNDEHAGDEGALEAIDEVPLRLAFDLGERSMTLGELRRLQVGEALELGRPLSNAVNLRVNGALVGSGELVEIDGRLGVSITALFGPPAAATAEASAQNDDEHHDDFGNDEDEAAEAEEE